MYDGKTDEQVLEELERKALQLLLKEPESERRALLDWADNDMSAPGLNPHLSSYRPNQACLDLIGSNLLLPDWMRARSIDPADVLQAEDFKDLIDRLTPTYGDH